MRNRRHAIRTQVTSLFVTCALAASQAGCILSSTETVKTDKVYLLGPKTESEPGPATRDVTMKAVDTRGTIAFHVDRARECTVTSTPRYQKVHIEGREGKNVTGGIVTGAVVLAAGAALLATSFLTDNGNWMEPESPGSDKQTFTTGGYIGIYGAVVTAVGLVLLPRSIYHAAVSGTTVTGGEIEVGTPPAGAERAPDGYDPKAPKVGALVPRLEQPRFGILDFGAKPAGEISTSSLLLRPTAKTVTEPFESLRSARAFDRVALESAPAADPALLAMPQSSDDGTAGDQMRACVAKYTPSCQSNCSGDRACVLACLRKPCIENLDAEVASGGLKEDEYRQVITKTEVCERTPDPGVGIAVIVKDLDGVPKTIELGKTNKAGDVKKDLLLGLESVYPGWPEIKQVVMQGAQVVLVEDPSVVVGELDLAKYPGLKYAEHAQATKRAREALAAAEAARREKEARDRQAMLEAAAKAQEDAAHAEERKVEAAKKAQACLGQAQSRCSADCQGNQACVKKCMQKVSCK